MRALALLSLIAGLATAPATPASSDAALEQAPPRFFGTWQLDQGRSKFPRGELPQRMTVVIEPATDGLLYRSDTHYAGGRSSASLYTARLDGTQAPVLGTVGFLAPVSLRRIDAATIAATYHSGLKEIAWSTWSVSSDGKALLVRTKYQGPNGEERLNVATFRRSES